MGKRLLRALHRHGREAVGWWKEYAVNPRSVGSILPSSNRLARAMTSAALRHGARDALIIEAGAGKGAITRVLAKHVPDLERFVACESLENFAQELQRRLPRVQVVCGPVQDLPHWQLAGSKTIVSSLPFRSLSRREEEEIARFFLKELQKNPRSVLVQFTYGLRNPIPLLARQKDISSFRHRVVWRNSPPATVWVYRAA